MTDDQLQYTVAEMYRIADQFRYDVTRYNLTTPDEVFNFVRSIPYSRDVDKCGSLECLQRPYFTVSGGDCDDKAIFAGACFYVLEIPWRFVTCSFRPDQEQEHIYLEIYVDGSWRPFDPTYPSNRIYTERTNTKKIIWSNPMPFKQGNYGVRTLEGGSLGFTPLLILADIDAILASLEKLPLIGSLFRGKTQHVDYPTALAKSQEIGQAGASIYNALPDATSKAYMLNLCTSFFNNWIMPDLGRRWDNAISNDFSAMQNDARWKDPAFRVYYYLGQPVFYFIFKEDATRVQESLVAWYTDPVKTKVWDPLDSYLTQNYGQTTGGGTAPPSTTTAGAGSMATIGLLAGLGILGAVMSKKKGRR